ncbi:Conserved_hypothetical protein [Hexamita inflata]|uniref:Tetratricopeptide repeat protein 21A/21B C-terminal ARM domain-containing protein n=1 Tax=Hexamita inflata TaxID=28002 RepID=A0AA86UN10_9EUKA|nr:Conserved hypothetical protein [Hexamita inflata]
MEEFCAIMCHHCILGEFGYVQQLLTQLAPKFLDQDTVKILKQVLNLALNSSSDLSVFAAFDSFDPLPDLIQYLYLNQFQVKETHKLFVLFQNLHFQAANPSTIILAFICCAIYDLKTFVEIFEKNADSETINYLLRIAHLVLNTKNISVTKKNNLGTGGNGSNCFRIYGDYLEKRFLNEQFDFEEMKIHSPMLFKIMHDQIIIQQNETLMGYFKNVSGSVSDITKGTFNNELQKLLLMLSAAAFEDEVAATTAVKMYFQAMNVRIGKIYLKQQEQRVISVMIQIARSYTTIGMLKALCEYIELSYDCQKCKQIHLLLAYLTGIIAIVESDRNKAEKAAQHFGDIFNRYLPTSDEIQLSVNGFILKTEDIYLLVQAMLGESSNNVYNTLKDIADEDKTFTVAISDLIQNQALKCDSMLESFANLCSDKVLQTELCSQQAEISYGNKHKDTLTALIVCKYCQNGISQRSIDNSTLQTIKNTFDLLIQSSVSSTVIRTTRLLIYQNLSLYDQMLKEASDITAFSMSQYSQCVSAQELLVFAQTAAQLYRHDVASNYSSQALIMEPSLQNSVEYQLISAQICSAKGEFLGAAAQLQQVLNKQTQLLGDNIKNPDLIPLRIHLALTRIKSGEMLGFQALNDLQKAYPVEYLMNKMTMSIKNPQYIGMHIAVQRARAYLYILRQAGAYNDLPPVEEQRNNFMFEHAILFIEYQQVVKKYVEYNNTVFYQSSNPVCINYIAQNYGLCPIDHITDIFATSLKPPNEKMKQYIKQNDIKTQTAIQLITPYLQYSQDAIDVLSRVQLLFMNNKLAYVNCFMYQDEGASSNKISDLANAYLAIGDSKKAEIYYTKSIEVAEKVIKTQNLPDYTDRILVSFLVLLKSRALSKCHRFKESRSVLENLFNKQFCKKVTPEMNPVQKMNTEAAQIMYGLICTEYMKFLIKCREYEALNQIIDSALANCNAQFQLNEASKADAIRQPIAIVYFIIQLYRAKAELIKLGKIQIKNKYQERQQLLEKAAFWCENNILAKVSRLMPANIDLQIKLQSSVFSMHQSTTNVEHLGAKEQIGIKAVVNQTEIKVDLAEVFMEQTNLNIIDFLSQDSQQLSTTQKQLIKQANEYAKQSLKGKSARALTICSIYSLLVEMNTEQAKKHAELAKSIEKSSDIINVIQKFIDRKVAQQENSEDDAQDAPAADSFTQLVNLLQKQNTVDILDKLLFEACRVKNIKTIINALFTEQAETIEETFTLGEEMDLEQLNNMNNKTLQPVTKQSALLFLAKGMLSLKIGRIQEGLRNIMVAANSQNLPDQYKARCLYLLGSTYINPSRSPLFGYTSSLTGKQQSAVTLQKRAMNNNVVVVDNMVDVVNDDDSQVPEMSVINQRDEDIQEAQLILTSMDQLSQAKVKEADVLVEVLRAQICIGMYKQICDKIQRSTLDGKKMDKRLEDEMKNQMAEAAETLHQLLKDNSKQQTLILYTLGILYTHLKNQPKARSSFQAGAKYNSFENADWIGVDASAQCSMALADQYMMIGKIANALSSLDEVLKLDKCQVTVYEMYGICMEKEAAFTDAVKHYETAWILSKGSPSVAYRLAYNYLKANRFRDAVFMCQMALNEWPGFNKLRTEVLFKAEAQLRRVHSVNEKDVVVKLSKQDENQNEEEDDENVETI